MKKLVVAVLAAIPFIASQSAVALEPWHDYYRAKAHKDKAKKRMAQAPDSKAQAQKLKATTETRPADTKK